jgi:hypothetical protein
MILKNTQNKTPVLAFAGIFSSVWDNVAGGKSCTKG